MPLLDIPQSGLAINAAIAAKMQSPEFKVTPSTANGKQASSQPFAMKINVTERFLNDLMAGKPGQPLMLSLGKSMTLGLAGQKQFEIAGTRESIRQTVFKLSTGSPLNIAGPLTHKLEVLEVEEKGTDADADLVMALKSQYDALGQHKKDRRAVLVDDVRILPPELSGKRGLIARRKAGRNGTFIEDRSITRQSTPNSPANMLNSPALATVKRVNLNSQTVKNDPLYIPLIHLLAITSDTEKNLAMKTHTKLKACLDVLNYMANRTRMGNHWELSDPNYRDLDVWRFPYPLAKHRDAAIQKATQAFDRLRLPRDALEREMLRKPEDRGKPLPELSEPKADAKGSHLSPPHPTPSIRLNDQELNKSGKLSPNTTAEPMSRTPSHQPDGKPKKDREQAAISKIILNGKNNLKGKPKPSPKPAAKEAKSTPKLPTPEAPKAMKKLPVEVKASAAKGGRKKEYKSREYIEDSDEDMDDANESAPMVKTNAEPLLKYTSGSKAISNSTKLNEAPKASQASAKSAAGKSENTKPSVSKTAPIKPIPSKPVASKTLPSKQLAEKQPNRPAGKKLPPTQAVSPRSASYSPNKKPSPLGSSPPINASDLRQGGNGSSASSSPLSSVGDDVSTPTPISAYTSIPVTKSSKTANNKESARPRYLPSDDDSHSPPLKRKAVEQDHSDGPARKASKTLSSSSESSNNVARKKALVGSDTEVVKKTLSSTVPRKRKAIQEEDTTIKKFTKTTYASSVSSAGSSSSSESLTRRAAELQVSELDKKTILLIKRFREDYARYQKLYNEVADNGRSSGEKLQAVLEMHKKLETMKARISASIA